jgi:serine/threonine-protein kinase
VIVVVSVGPGEVAIPQVTNVDQVAAAAQLATAGLQVRTVQEASDTIAAGKVIRTLPPAGQVVPKATEVTMVVSTGAQPIPVPNVEGKAEAEARNELQAAGFLQRVVYQDVPNGSSQAGRVISQSPGPGTELPKGQTVTLVVGKAVPPATTTTTSTTTTTVSPTSTT